MGLFTSAVTQLLSGNRITGAWADNWYSLLKALTDPLTGYSPAFTTSGTAPSGQVTTGFYQQTGKFVYGRALVTLGAGLGTGNYFVSMPVATTEVIPESAGSAHFNDTSASVKFPLSVFWISTTVVSFGIPSTGARVTNLAPVTAAAGDQLSIKFLYEAA